MYTYRYERPALTVDAVVFGKSENGFKLLLIQRKNDPFKGKWALPGGFFDMGETVEEAVHRELKEETGLKNVELSQLKVFSKPDRDPREQTVSVAFSGVINIEEHNAKAGSDASDVKWFPVDSLPELAFDHEDIIKAALLKIS